MPIAKSLLNEFDAEMANTRRMLERMPERLTDWKPHEKSMAFNRLAALVAEMPSWVVGMLKDGKHDIPADYELPVPDTRDGLLQLLERNVADARKTIEQTPDDAFDKNWSLVWGGQTAFSMPRGVAYRQMFLNHLIHHRAQLTVYFRLNGIPVPGLYGGSADEH